MNNKLPISCFIIAKNEADRISKTIESVIDIVDEVIVIDSGSTDGTQNLVKELGCKVFFNKWKRFGPQKRFGEDCKNEWLLNLDADEYLSDEIKSEILQTFENNNDKYTIFFNESNSNLSKLEKTKAFICISSMCEIIQ